MATAWVALCNDACARGDVDEAHRALELALAAAPDLPRTRELAATLLAECGYGDEARGHGEWLTRRAPAEDAAWSAFLSSLKLGTPIEPALFAEAHRAFGRQHDASCGEVDAAPGRQRKRRLLIGGFEAHVAVTRFVPSLLSNLPDDFEAICAFDTRAMLDLYRARWPQHSYLLLPRQRRQRVAQARRQRADVFLDLAGHAPRNCIELLAERVAPVQVTWLDYLATTGLAAADYRITDAVADPDGNEAFHTEALLRLPFAAWCYEPWPNVPAVRAPRAGAPPRLACAAVPAKLNATTLGLFREVLLKLPDARLALFGFRSAVAMARVREHVGAEVARRIDFEPRQAPAAYLDRLSDVDLLLDPVGFSGGTATLDALWQGVPVVTKPLVLSHTRTSASLLDTAGMGELVAADDAGYVERACATVEADRSRPALRAERRERLRTTPLIDAGRFATALFRGLRDRLRCLLLPAPICDVLVAML